MCTLSIISAIGYCISVLSCRVPIIIFAVPLYNEVYIVFILAPITPLMRASSVLPLRTPARCLMPPLNRTLGETLNKSVVGGTIVAAA